MRRRRAILDGKSVRRKIKVQRIAIGLGLVSSVFLPGAGQSAGSKPETMDSSWSVLAGYGMTHPDLGETKTRVETVDVILRYDKPLTEQLGDSWYRGRHTLVVELPVSFVTDPQTDPMVGLTFLGTWYFDTDRSLQPYLFGGGGVVYTGADIEGLGSKWNGNWQFGAGVRYHVDDWHTLNLEYRFHHISNLDTADPNDPLNASKILLGLTF